REQREVHVDRRGERRAVAARRHSGAPLSGMRAPVEDQDVADSPGGQVVGDARADDPPADDGDAGGPHDAKTPSGLRKLLNSSALPLGSRRNIVACSPVWPAKRTRGSMMNAVFAPVRREARSWNSCHERTAP